MNKNRVGPAIQFSTLIEHHHQSSVASFLLRRPTLSVPKNLPVGSNARKAARPSPKTRRGHALQFQSGNL
jgi:hypothetical protein